MRFDIITAFPQIFQSYFGTSILKRAREKGLIEIHTHNLRNFSKDKRRTIDDTPYGGGAGMVLMAEPIVRAVASIKYKVSRKAKIKVAVLSAKGKQFNQKMAYDWTKKYESIILVSGRYEGIDERLKPLIRDTGYSIQELSIGPYVLTDGDVAAMAIVSAVARLIPGVIKKQSLDEESFGSSGHAEYPHYTRPEIVKYNGKIYRIPKILLSGNHAAIAAWRKRHMKRVRET